MVNGKKRLPYSAALVAIVVAAAVAGCGSDDDDAGDAGDAGTVAPTTAAPSPAPAATSATPDGSSAPAGTELPVMVEAFDYKFEAIPADFAAGTQLTLTNLSDKEVHEIVAFRLPETETRAAAELMALPEAELGALFSGEPATVIIAPPESDGFPVVGDGVLSEPGRYLFVCTIPTGADPEEFMAAAQASSEGPPDVAGGPPHFVNGMFAEAVVT